MSSAILQQHLAPFDLGVWNIIEEESKERLQQHLIGRKIVDVESPKGLEFSSINTGLRERLKNGSKVPKEQELYVRQTLPVFEIFQPFEITKEDVENIYRGCGELKDTDSLEKAVKAFSESENQIVFQGNSQQKLSGVFGSAETLTLKSSDTEKVVEETVKAMEMMKKAYVGGPYVMLVNYEDYAMLLSAPGYPVAKKLLAILGEGGKIIPNDEVGKQIVITSTRGGDYKLHLGNDISIGYRGETKTHYELFYFESLTFEVKTPEACVLIKR